MRRIMAYLRSQRSRKFSRFHIATLLVLLIGVIAFQINNPPVSINPYQIGAIIYVDGTKYACNAAGFNAALAALPTTGNTPGGTVISSCSSATAVVFTAPVVIGTSTVPMTLRLNSGNYAFSNTSGNGFVIQGSGSRLLGNGDFSTFITCNVGFTGDIVHVEPQSSALAINAIDVGNFRIDQANCPNVIAINILSVRDPSVFHNIDIRNWLGTALQDTTSGNAGAIIPQGLAFRDVYLQSAAGTLTATTVNTTGNEIQWTASKVILDPAAVQGTFPLMTIQPTATSQGDGRRMHITDSSFACAGGANSLGLLVTNPVGSATGAQGNEIGPRTDFELCNTGWKLTGSDASHKAQNNHVLHNVYLPSTNNLGSCDFCSNNIIEEITNGNASDIILTANSNNNLFLGFITNLTDISNSNSANSIFNCRNVSNSAVCSLGTNAGAGSSYFTADTFQQASLLNTGTADNIFGNLRLNVLKGIETTAPSAASGQDICYGDSTAHAFECAYNNGAFSPVVRNSDLAGGTLTGNFSTLQIGGVAVSQDATAYQTGTYTNATTGFTNVTGLSFSVAASKNYKIKCDLAYSTNNNVTGGLKIQWTGPASPTAVTYDLVDYSTAAAVSDAVATTFSTSLAGSVPASTSTNFVFTTALTLINGSNAGTAQLQAAATGTGTITIIPGSCSLQN